jgi:hypothetical protein
VLLCATAVLLAQPAAAHAQALGIGARFAMIRGDVDADESAERFTGGHLRLGVSRRMSVELSLDMKTRTNEAETERIRNLPFQASLLLYPARGSLSPFLLGGIGWYSTRVEQLDGDDVITSVTTRKRGYHAGFGAELRMGRHAGLHGDYRYTFLNFNDDDEDDDEDDDGFLGSISPSRLLPGYEGSMWTVGLTIYF